MSSAVVLPVPKSLFLCEGHIGLASGKSDLVNIFNAINPRNYPHIQKDFVVYARLSQGLGQIPFYVDIRFAPTYQMVHVSKTFMLSIPNRDKTVEMVLTIKQVQFPQPGVYLLQLYLDDQWVCDTTLILL